MNDNPLDQATLKRLFTYDPETGVFTRNTTHKRNKTIKAGDVAGAKTPRGYRRISINNIQYAAHRLAWLYVYGALPELWIDHINGDKDDNRIANLRQATISLNSQNIRVARKGSYSGLLGVSWHKKLGKFQSSIFVNKRLIHIGLFEDKHVAHEAYLNAKRKYHEGNTL